MTYHRSPTRRPVTGSAITKMCDAPMPTDLWGLYQAQTTRYRALCEIEPRDRTIRLADPVTGAQFHAWKGLRSLYGLSYIAPGASEFTGLYWLTPTGSGVLGLDGERSQGVVPRAAIEEFARALPLPLLGELYGRQQAGRVDALYYAWEADDESDERCRVVGFWSAQDPDRSDLVRPGTDFVDTRLWWGLVAAGTLRNFTEAAARSRGPIESAPEWDGTYRYLLCREREEWTGVPGPVLYACDGSVTMKMALAVRDAKDARPCLLAALDRR